MHTASLFFMERGMQTFFMDNFTLTCILHAGIDHSDKFLFALHFCQWNSGRKRQKGN